MSHMKRIAPSAWLGLAMGALAAPALGQNVEPLSKRHITYGISQFNYAEVGTDQDITLMNPNRVDHLVAVLAYAREVDRYVYHGFDGQLTFKRRVSDLEAETFLACAVVHLTPHAAKRISVSSGGLPPSYVETISVPRIRATLPDGSTTRLADTLGTRLATTADSAFSGQAISVPQGMAHPSLFTLPDDRPWWQDPEARYTQFDVALDCICGALVELRNQGIRPVSVYSFQNFGLDCLCRAGLECSF